MSFQRGNLAIVVACPHARENIGLIVTLIKRGVGDRKGTWLIEGNLKHSEGNIAQMLPDEIPFLRAWAKKEWLKPLPDASTKEVEALFSPVPSREKEAA